ncbi:neuraminidase-like domain-containing protein [Kosakonia sp. YIM B13611]|uniref:Tc toxin subunit A-related protein n=1 Tax=unclassified Kosakonia TaxID=2632876 RepID=UPI0036C117F4
MYDIDTILSEINTTRSSALDVNRLLSSLMPYSAVEIREAYKDVLTWGEANYLSSQVRDAQKKNKETEARILSRANPQLTRAIRLGISQTRTQTQSQNLRDYDSQFGNRTQQYVAPGSVASMFSPAGYLTELYREARDLHTTDNVRHLDNRRPDLTRLALSQDNMDAEVSTLSIANDIVLTNLVSIEGTDSDTVMEKLSTWRLSGNTPYHQPYEGARQAILLQDPMLDALAENPAIAQQVDLNSLLAIMADVSPELYSILIEEITPDNAVDLYAKNFGAVTPDALKNVYAQASYFDVSIDELEALTGLLSSRDFSESVQYYINNMLTMLVAGEETAGQVSQFIRTASDNYDGQLNYMELLPQGGDSYLLSFNVKYTLGNNSRLLIGTSNDSGNLYQNDDFVPQANQHISVPVTLTAEQLTNGVLIGISRKLPTTGAYHFTAAKFRLYTLSAEQYLLYLNKITRLFKACHFTPEQMYLLIYNNPGEEPFETDMLGLSFLSYYYLKRYSMRFEDALVLAGGHISAVGVKGQPSYFTTLFNTPQLINREFSADGAAVDWDSQDVDHLFRASVIKRGFHVSGADLKTLWQLAAGGAAFTATQENLALLYRTQLLADVHQLTVSELRMLLSVSAWSQTPLGSLNGGGFASLVTWLHGMIRWLKTLDWTVGELYLMVTSNYSRVLTPEIENLVTTLRGTVSTDNLDPATLMARMAPIIAAACQLGYAGQAQSILSWLDQLKPAGTDVKGFVALVLKDDRTAAETASLVTFCQILGQLTLLVRKTGISDYLLSALVANPALVAGRETVTALSLDTVQRLSRVNRRIMQTGDYAQQVLTAVVGGGLAPDLLAQALAESTQSVSQAMTLSGAGGAITSLEMLDVTLQWLDFSAALNCSPQTVASLIALKYINITEGNSPTYEDWVAVSNLLQAGLSPAQTTALQQQLEERTSAALSSYYIQTAGNADVTNREQLYVWLLVDGQVSSQVMTTRVAEAIASLQLYINRCQNSLEAEIQRAVLTRQFFTDWDRYNKRYSTWAGVSQLAYYPENYIDPTVRTGQTSMMDNMLNTIGQSALSSDTVGDAFRGYMTQFEKVANLDIVSAYHDNASMEEGKTWFIGRSMVDGERYYWRSLQQSMLSNGKYPATAWSEWLEIGTGIAAYNKMVRPVIFNDRLYVVWVTEQPVAKDDGGTVTESTDYFLSFSYLRHDGSWSSPLSETLSEYLPAVDISDMSSKHFYCTNSNENSPEIVAIFYTPAASEASNQSLTVSGLTISVEHNISASTKIDFYHSFCWRQYDTESEQQVSFLFMAEIAFTTGSLGYDWGYESLSIMLGGSYRINSITLDADKGFVYVNCNMNVRYIFNGVNGGSFGNNKRNWINLIKSAGSVYRQYTIYTRPFKYTYGETTNEGIAIDVLDGFNSSRPVRSLLKTERNIVTLGAEMKDGTKLKMYGLNNIVGMWGTEWYYFSDDHGQLDNIVNLYTKDDFHLLELFSAPIKYSTVVNPEDVGYSVTAASGYVLSKNGSSGMASPGWDTTYSFTNTKLTFPVSEFRQGKLDLTIRFYAKNSMGQSLGVQSATMSIYQRADSRKFSFARTDSGAQYLQRGAYRTRINTLFARQLVARANLGLDAVLSMETQLLQEPKLGKGNYVTVTLPAYNAEVHGSNANVQLSISPLSSSATNTTRYSFWSGVLQSSPLIIQIFVPTSQTAYGDPVQFPEDRNKGLAVFLTCQKGTYYQGVFANITVSDLSLTGFTTNSERDAKRDVSIDVLTAQNTEPMDFAGANALYFWEMFFYVPSMVFQRLLHESKFEEATTWMKYIWNPAGYYNSDGTPAPWTWNVRPLEEDISWNPDPLDSVDPDAVAQSDPMHYKVATFMRVLDLLIARGDAAYRLLERDTLNEAKMWYVQALNLLGDEPADSLVNGGWSNPVLGSAASQTLKQTFQLEMINIREQTVTEDVTRTANSLLGLFYPQMNDRLSSYWQTLRQRLYNLRHNLSIDGQPLYLSVYATAASPSALLSAAVASANGGDSLPSVSLPLLRFPALLESARSLANQLTQFGSTMQVITERQDAEALSLLLQSQGLALLSQSIAVQEHAITELDADKDALTVSRQGAEERRNSYRKLYDENVNAGEAQAMDLLSIASVTAEAANALNMGAAALDLVPNLYGVADGGSRYGGILSAVGFGIQIAADRVQLTGNKIAQSEIYRRRRQEWEIQRNNAEAEMKQIDAQLASLAVRREGVVLQKAQVETQLAQTQAQLDWLQGKFTGQALYSWLRATLATIYYQFYDVAITRCLQAQRAWQWYFNDDATTFIKPGAWQANWLGFMSGETLLLSLASMEQAWINQDSRMAEISKTISLKEVYSGLSTGAFTLAEQAASLVSSGSGSAGSGGNTLAVASGELQASIKLADLNILSDYPASLGATRRIKQVSVTLPLQVEPYQDIRAVLSYGGSVVLPRGGNALAVSHGMNDSGQFQLDFNDGRALPFEGIPVDDSGTLTLSFPDIAGEQKDLLIGLTDIILHIRYTITG